MRLLRTRPPAVPPSGEDSAGNERLTKHVPERLIRAVKAGGCARSDGSGWMTVVDERPEVFGDDDVSVVFAHLREV